MAEPNSIDDRRSRRPVLVAALVLGGAAAVAWWRQARSDPALVERTRARLAGADAESGGGTPEAKASTGPKAHGGVNHPGSPPAALFVRGTSEIGTPGGTSSEAPPINAALRSDRLAGPQANHHYPPDLSGLRAG